MRNINFGSVNIFKHPSLPIDETFKACDIKTKEEVNILSGEKIHAFEMNGNIYMSDYMYEKTKSNFKNETP